MGKHSPEGLHLLGTLHWKKCQNFPSVEKLVDAAKKAAEASGATVMNINPQPFPDGGPAVVLTLAESHLSIHTWPERRMCYADIFTCGKKCDPAKGFLILKQELNVRGKFQIFKRKPGGGILWMPAISMNLMKR